MSLQREEALNTALAGLLAKRQGIDAVAEYKIVGGQSIDVLVTVRKLNIAVEAKLAADPQAALTKKQIDKQIRDYISKAAKQAAGRVRDNHTDLGAAVMYPPGTDSATVGEAELVWSAAPSANAPTRRKTGEEAVHRGYAKNFADWLTWLGGDPGDVVGRLLGALKQASLRLTKAQREAMVESFGIDERRQEKGAVRCLLMVAAAVMFHSRLQEHLRGLEPPDDPSLAPRPWPPKTPIDCTGDDNPVMAFSEAWRQILLVDYKPVFESARGVLTSMAHCGHNFAQAVKIVADTALSIAGTAASMRHDLLGRVFHRVLDTARYDGSFYTSSAAAALLAGLSLTDSDSDWSDTDAAAGLRIVDPCCGSGTLLMAAAERIKDLRSAAVSADDAEDDFLLSAMLIEDVLWGYDINLAACHLTATTLGLLAPRVDFNRMNVFRTRLGVEDRAVSLGSLDLLADSGETPDGTQGLQLSLQPMAPGEHNQVETGDDQKRASNPPPMDLVIMNPPFTRDSLRHDQHVDDEEAIKKREKQLLKGHPRRGAARLHSSGGMFLLLAERLVRKSAPGTAALVLPAVAATTAGNLDFRKFLAESFHVEHVIIPHDPQRIAFSENTSISEMLIVARRHPDPPEQRPPTRFAKLLRNPDNPADSNLLAGRIAAATPGARPDMYNSFVVDEVPAARIANGDWQAIGFLSDWLYKQWKKLVAGNPRLSDIAEIGPAGQGIRGAYDKTTISTGRKALWNHKSELVTTLAANADTFITPKPGKNKPRTLKDGTTRPGSADRYWQQKSRLLIANRLNLPTMRLAAVRLDSPAVGSAFCPARPNTAVRPPPQQLAAVGEVPGRVVQQHSRRARLLRSPRAAQAAVPDVRRKGLARPPGTRPHRRRLRQARASFRRQQGQRTAAIPGDRSPARQFRSALRHPRRVGHCRLRRPRLQHRRRETHRRSPSRRA